MMNDITIGKAEEAVEATNLSQVQQIAALAWSEAYIDKISGVDVDLYDEVVAALEENDVDVGKYAINVTDDGVDVQHARLGALITGPEDYGKTVDYIAGGITSWKIYYEDEVNGYVYLIAADKGAAATGIETGVEITSLTNEEIEIYKKFQVGNWAKYELNNSYPNSKGVAYLIRGFNTTFANKAKYGDYVIGALGAPTLELLVEGWNAKGYSPKLTLNKVEYGYLMNGTAGVNVAADGLYITNFEYLLATPGGSDNGRIWRAATNRVDGGGYYGVTSRYTRPVVCLSSDIPADWGTTTAFTLEK